MLNWQGPVLNNFAVKVVPSVYMIALMWESRDGDFVDLLSGKGSIMALYCLECKKQVKDHTKLKEHIILCWQDKRLHGGVYTAGTWATAFSNLKTLVETYYTSEDPDPPDQLDKARRDVIWDALFHEGVRDSIKIKLQGVLQKTGALSTFDADSFRQRLAISGRVTNELVYYRKMSHGEYDASKAKAKNPFAAAFEYTNKKLYRYWISSSLAKVQAFGNENNVAAGSTDLIVRMEFTQPLTRAFGRQIKAHQTSGVQGAQDKVALHREGFADLGNIGDDDLPILLEEKFDINLGFTEFHSAELAKILKTFERV